jgi:sarcosine oxidase
MPQPSVIVVGGGAMGTSAARELARRGHPVTVLEQHEMQHSRGSSHGTSRIVRLGYADPFYVRLSLAARPMWDELQQQNDVEVFRRTGSVDHGPRHLLEPVAAALDETGVAYEWLTTGEASRRWPGLRFDESVLFQPDGGVAHPDNTLTILRRDAIAHGAEWHTKTPVDAIDETAEGVSVVAGEHVFTADHAVLAAGVWSHRLADLPRDIAIQVQPAHFAAIDPGTPWPTFIHRRADEHGNAMPEAYGLPSPDGTRSGSTAAARSSIPTTGTSPWSMTRSTTCGRTSPSGYPVSTRRPLSRARASTAASRRTTSSSTARATSPLLQDSRVTASSSSRSSGAWSPISSPAQHVPNRASPSQPTTRLPKV